MKCSLGISDFLEEISSLSHSIVFLYFFARITEASIHGIFQARVLEWGAIAFSMKKISKTDRKFYHQKSEKKTQSGRKLL